MSRLAALLVLVALAPAATGGKFNKTLSVGHAAPAWADLDGTDGANATARRTVGGRLSTAIASANPRGVASSWKAGSIDRRRQVRPQRHGRTGPGERGDRG